MKPICSVGSKRGCIMMTGDAQKALALTPIADSVRRPLRRDCVADEPLATPTSSACKGTQRCKQVRCAITTVTVAFSLMILLVIEEVTIPHWQTNAQVAITAACPPRHFRLNGSRRCRYTCRCCVFFVLKKTTKKQATLSGSPKLRDTK